MEEEKLQSMAKFTKSANIKNRKGITLIALVVTIIVILILAGISINMLTGDNGVLKQATNAKVQTVIAEKREEVGLAIASSLADNLGDSSKVTVSSVVNEVKKNYSSTKEKNAITGKAITEDGEDAEEGVDTFPGKIIYSKSVTNGLGPVVITVDEGLRIVDVGIGEDEKDDYSELETVDLKNSTYAKVGTTYCNTPDLSGFNPESTYYVTYDAQGNNETILGRIDRMSTNGNKLVTDNKNNVWYDYGNKIWANVVTVTGSEVTYWVWVPRYRYTNSGAQSDVKFVQGTGTQNADGTITDTCTIVETNGTNTTDKPFDVSGYELPDSFKFDKKNLTGYWVSKYEVQTSGNGEVVYKTKKGKETTISTTNPSGKYTVFIDGVQYGNEPISLPAKLEGVNARIKHDICIVSDTNKKMIGRTSSSADNIDVDLSGFNPENTYYVTYDEKGNNEKIAGRMDKISEPENWYDYNRKIWANVVTVKEGAVTYWTYVPKYEYTKGLTNGISALKFISKKQQTSDNNSFYEIPDSFKFGDKDLKGYWVSKYEVQTVGNAGIETISSTQSGKNVTITSSSASGTYAILLDGKPLKGKESVTLPCTIEVGEGTEYDILVVSNEKSRIVGQTRGITQNNVEVDLTGFNPECTYYVLYDSNGNNEKIGDKIQLDAQGKAVIPDISKGVWYDYNRKIWANVVTKNKDEIAYWTYIPRFECVKGLSSAISSIKFMNISDKPNNGYEVPDSFKFGTHDLKGFWVSKYEVQ